MANPTTSQTLSMQLISKFSVSAKGFRHSIKNLVLNEARMIQQFVLKKGDIGGEEIAVSTTLTLCNV